jgi:hypothetical protein
MSLFSLGALDAGEDLVGVFGPGERPGVLVPVVDEGADGLSMAEMSSLTEAKLPRGGWPGG